jgi:hypothetical protein
MMPMHIDYSAVFSQMHKQAQAWRANLDFDSVHGRETQRLKNTRPPDLPSLRKDVTLKGRHVNIQA